MRITRAPFISEVPYYMSAIGMQGARFIEGDPDAGNPIESPTGDDPDADEDKPLGPNGEKALAAERARASKAEKDLADAKAQLQQIEDAKLNDIQRAQKEATDAAAKAATLEADNWKLAALAEHPVPKEYRHLVNGTNADTFMASAKDVSALAAAAAGKGPKPDPVRESGDRTDQDSTSKGGSIAAGRAMYADKHKKKEG